MSQDFIRKVTIISSLLGFFIAYKVVNWYELSNSDQAKAEKYVDEFSLFLKEVNSKMPENATMQEKREIMRKIIAENPRFASMNNLLKDVAED